MPSSNNVRKVTSENYPTDVVVTQDYGLASMCLAKRARVLNQNGLEYTADNIDALMLRRYENKKLLRAGKHPKGSPKRTKEQDVAFSTHFKAILEASRRLMLKAVLVIRGVCAFC